jgi:NYN domain
MTPVSIYVDGFNLYHALVKFRDEKVKWLDLRALSQRVIRPKTERIVAINYFSAYADWLPGPKSRHEEYVNALTALGVNCILGHFKRKDRTCFACGAKWVAHEEKETDVSIGITLLNDAYKGAYEKAYLVTRDSDLLPAIKMVRVEFPAKEIVAVAPPLMGHSNDLIKLCQEKKKISPEQIWSCLLPREVKRANGTVAATRPKDYD